MSTDIKHLKTESIQPTQIAGGALPIDWWYYAKVIVCIVFALGILYYSYNSFYENQCVDPFVEKQTLDGIAHDRSFDITLEVQRLSDIQEKYLEELNGKRNG
jgi:hypothetical protein